MSNIVISGYYGFGNAGDEAMLCAIIDAIRDVEGDAHITVISGNPQETSRKHNIKAVGTFAAFGIFNAISNADLVISWWWQFITRCYQHTEYILLFKHYGACKITGETSYAVFSRYWSFVSKFYKTCSSIHVTICGWYYRRDTISKMSYLL